MRARGYRLREVRLYYEKHTSMSFPANNLSTGYLLLFNEHLLILFEQFREVNWSSNFKFLMSCRIIGLVERNRRQQIVTQSESQMVV